MTALYTGSAKNLFLGNTSPDVSTWGDFYKLASPNSPLIDRCEIVQMPFNYKLYDKFKMPRDLTGFNKTFEECCVDRAQEIVNLSKQLSKKITVFYSGGIDSTLVLISFMKLLNSAEFKSTVDIALSHDSIQENPEFYYNYIRPMGNIVPSVRLPRMFDKSTILVGGEHSDQIFGSDIIGKVASVIPDFKYMHTPYTRETITSFLSQSMGNDSANKWFDLLDNHIKQAPCEVSTNYHFWWWLNFSFKWQNVFFRMLFRVAPEQQEFINQDFVDLYYHHFYSTVDFQKWSMLNHDLKIKDDWKSYKWEAKRLIYEFDHNADYRDNKIKIGSLGNLFRQQKGHCALTDDYQYLSTINPDEFYVPNNSFN